MESPPPFHPGPQQPSPEQRLFLMDDKDWEAFIEECARQLKREEQYSQVVRIGGAGDKGRDVCAYTQEHPAEGTWDLYQAKHYKDSLAPSEFAPELAKFLSSVYQGAYTLPRNYFICALKVGPKLFDLVLNPHEIGGWLIEEWKKKKGGFDSFKKNLSPELEAFIKTFVFNIVKIKTPADLLEIHYRSDKHWERFGVLAQRGPNPPIPEEPTEEEQTYVAALLKIYSELSGKQIKAAANIPPNLTIHLKTQRRLFYNAEGLNRFSRDKLPGAFDDLVDQVELGVGAVVSYPHPDGMARLKETLVAANSLQVTSNPLHARLQAADLQGTCHHLANQERIIWVDTNE